MNSFSPARLKLSCLAATQNVRRPRSEMLARAFTGRASGPHDLFRRPVDEKQAPMLLGAVRVAGIALPRLVEGLEEEHGHVGLLRPVAELAIVARLLRLAGAVAEL